LNFGGYKKVFFNSKCFKVKVILIKMGKRGLSNIIATFLIVLLALAAVAIIWIFVQPSFVGAGKDFENELILSRAKFALVPDKTLTFDQAVDLSFTIERKAGGSEVDGFIVVLDDDEGNVVRIDRDNVLDLDLTTKKQDEFERFLVTVQTSQFRNLKGNINRLSIYPVIHNVDGEEVVGTGASTTKNVFIEPPMEISSCGFVINDPGSYVITGDLVQSGVGSCISANGIRGIIIDGQGNSIIGPNTPEGNGLVITGSEEVIVKDLEIFNVNNGIVILNQIAYLGIENVNIHDNSVNGVISNGNVEHLLDVAGSRFCSNLIGFSCSSSMAKLFDGGGNTVGENSIDVIGCGGEIAFVGSC
jgi:hypothetical protein